MILHVLAIFGVVVTAALAVHSRDLLKATVFLAAMSLLLSLEFFLLQAPDVAITEAAVGAGLSTAIFVIAIKKTRRMEE